MGTLVWSCVWLLYVTVARLLMLVVVFTVCRLVVVRAARQNSAPRLGLSAAVPPGPRLGSTTQQTWNKNFRNSDAAYRGEGSRAGAGKVFTTVGLQTHI